jgi:hypothetical protein
MKIRKMKKVLSSIMTVILAALSVMQFIQPQTVKASSLVSEETLYEYCPEYLNNYAYSNFMQTCEGAIQSGLEDVSQTDKTVAAILESMQNGATIIVNEVASMFGLTLSMQEQINREVVMKLVQEYSDSPTYLSDTIKEIDTAVKSVNTAIEWTNRTAVMQYALELSENTKISKEESEKLVEDFLDGSDDYKELRKNVKDATKIAKVIAVFVELHEIDNEILNSLYEIYDSYNSDFAEAIEILKEERKDIVTFIRNNYLNEKVCKEVVSYIENGFDKNAIKAVNLLGKVLKFTNSEFVPDVKDIAKASLYEGYTYMSRNVVNDYMNKIISGNATKGDIENFKTAYGFYITTTKVTMKKVADCVDATSTAKKQKLLQLSSALAGLGYDSYIEACCECAAKDIDDGLLELTDKKVKKTPSGTVIDKSYDSTESITARLSVIMQKYPVGSTWTGSFENATQCFGFAKLVFYNLYGVSLGTTYYSSARYQYYNSGSVYLVGQVAGNNVNSTSVAQLMTSAKIGDVIQVCGATYGQHTMIFLGLTANGIQVYDCNSHLNNDTTDCRINNWEISYAQLASWYGTGNAESSNGISIYRANNYAEIYGNGDGMFYDDSVNFVIEDGVLVKYNGWQTYVEIPDTVTAIGEGAFEGNQTMMQVSIPDSVKSIGKRAFYGCTNLRYVIIPDSVETIGASAFSYCTRLVSVKLPENNKFTSISESVFSNCTSLTGIEIPDTVTIIDYGVFSGCESLKEIVLPDSVTSLGGNFIGTGVFQGCVSLENVTMPKRLEHIGQNTFYGCESLTEIFIPKTVTGTDYYGGAFANCPNLKTITIEEGMTVIPENLFSGCTSIESIVIPDTVTKIDYGAFSGCTGLKEIVLPNSVTSLGGNFVGTGVFQGCVSLAKVTMPKRLEHIGQNTFYGCESLTEIFIPKTVTGTDYYAGAFANCPNLKTITIEEGMTVIPENLFSGCASIESIIIPDSVTKIDGSAFANCVALSDVTLSKNLTEIGTAAFKNCGFETIEFPESLTKIGTSAFAECSKLTEVTVPETIEDIPQYMFSACTKLAKVNLPDNIKKISTGMFTGCTSLTDITIPESVGEICGSAFYGCESLTEINIPNNVKSIGAGAFANCENLSTVKLSNSLTKINEETFSDCPSLEKIVLLPGITEIADRAFQHCAKLKEVYIPQTVETISDKAFSYYDKITIYGMKGSYAEQWANDNDVKFEEYENPATDLQLSETKLRIQRGEEHKLNITVVPEDYTDIVTWTSSNEDIVKVTSDGTLRTSYWNTGTATITVTAGTKSATCVVTVYDPDAVEDDNNGDDIGNDDDTEDNTNNIEVTEDSSYQITENTDLETTHGTSLTITGVQTNTTVADCIKNFGDSDEISIVDKNGNEVNDDAKVGTGFEVQKKADGVVIQVAVIIIKGDTDGTGTIDVLDMEAIQKSILGISKLIGAYKSAAIISSGETDISVLDMEAVQKDILGIAKIK